MNQVFSTEDPRQKDIQTTERERLDEGSDARLRTVSEESEGEEDADEMEEETDYEDAAYEDDEDRAQPVDRQSDPQRAID